MFIFSGIDPPKTQLIPLHLSMNKALRCDIRNYDPVVCSYVDTNEDHMEAVTSKNIAFFCFVLLFQPNKALLYHYQILALASTIKMRVELLFRIETNGDWCAISSNIRRLL